MDLVQKTLTALQETFHPSAPLRSFHASGRVNLIGEHTDYNDGFVLPAAINFHTVVAAAPRTDSTIEVYAVDMADSDTFDLTQPITPSSGHPWANYVRGMAKVLLEEGQTLRGLSLAIAGDVPTGAGLSSSASLEMALGHAFLQSNNQPIDPVSLALAGQNAENNFVGVQCGIMDQLISALGEKDHALLIDCRSLEHTAVPIPADTAIVIVDSGVRRGLVDSEYNARRRQCAAAAEFFGVHALRDVDMATFTAREHQLSPVLRRRARHVISENERTLAAADALKQNDLAAFGYYMNESHRSMRDDFEITTPEIDMLVEIMQSVAGVYGARMTGGGFGGCCVALAPTDVVPELTDAVDTVYHQKACCYHATVYRCYASAGASELIVQNTTL